MKDGMEKLVERAHSRRTAAVLAVQTTVLNSMTSFLYGEGFVQLCPVMLSPITDPLCHSVYDAEVEYEGQKLQLTKSMILHKQIAISSPHLEKIFILSPNVRLEKSHLGPLGRYLIEFTQLDMEMKGKTKKEFMSFMERMLSRVFSDVAMERGPELELLGRRLAVPKAPFPVYESKEWRKKLGEFFEAELSKKEKSPFWVMDHAREFYDKEDSELKGYYHNYDLLYPEGFGEGLSGAERDYSYPVLSRKLAERGQKEEHFGPYMELSKSGRLVPSAGGGIGVERLVRYICGLPHISEVGPFTKVPGENFVV